MAFVPQQSMNRPAQRIVMGRVGSTHGVHGWVRVWSYTDPERNLLDYSPWQLKRAGECSLVQVVHSRMHGRRMVVKLAGYDDRDAAESLLGAEILVERQKLPALATMEYYWADLLGARVVNGSGVELGRVVGLLSTGANDVLRIQGDRDRLIPFLLNDVIREVDLEQHTIRVDWEPDF